jgi:uncharacterized membrane protein YfcA
MNQDSRITRRIVLFALAWAALAVPAAAYAAAMEPAAAAWWVWPLALFLVCFVLGIVAVPAGIGGGVLFVPVVSGFFPFHFDFVRGAGLLVALASALAAGPGLLRSGLADLRLALPLALLASVGAIVGALVGLALPVAPVQVALGVTILCIAAIMWRARRTEYPDVQPDALAAALRLNGVFHEPGGRAVAWQATRTPAGLALFAFIGMLAGLFGLGAGWANVPALNLVMGVPLKVSAGTSGVILSLVDSAAAWIYLHQGALLPIVAAPSVIGMMLGSFIGGRLLGIMRTVTVRRLVIVMLLFAGVRALARGIALWN